MTAGHGPISERHQALLSRLFDLRDLHVLVTGAASGLGRLIAEAMTDAGADLTLVDTDADALEEVAGELAGRGGTIAPTVCDISDAAAVASAVQQGAGRFPSLDVVFANAGIAGERRADQQTSGIEQVRHEDWNRVLSVNLTGALLGIQSLAPLMRAGGSIVNVSSLAALGGYHAVAYTVAKWGLRGLSRVASLELGDRGIRVNSVLPGPVWTPLIPASFPAEHVDQFGAKTLLGRPAEPDEIAPSYIFLASDDGICMSGQVLHPNGGEIVGG